MIGSRTRAAASTFWRGGGYRRSSNAGPVGAVRRRPTKAVASWDQRLKGQQSRVAYLIQRRLEVMDRGVLGCLGQRFLVVNPALRTHEHVAIIKSQHMRATVPGNTRVETQEMPTDRVDRRHVNARGLCILGRRGPRHHLRPLRKRVARGSVRGLVKHVSPQRLDSDDVQGSMCTARDVRSTRPWPYSYAGGSHS